MKKLTHKQIDAMEAGREMDALVAELVMEKCFATLSWDDIPEFGLTAGEATGEPLPCSTDIATAFQALDTFDRKEWDIEIISDTEDEGKLWGVTLNKYTSEPVGIVAIGSAGSVSLASYSMQSHAKGGDKWVSSVPHYTRRPGCSATSTLSAEGRMR